MKGGQMVRLQSWQWAALALPIVSICGLVLIAAGVQIHNWGINWIWILVGLMFLLWRWLLVRWTQPELLRMQALVAEVTEELDHFQPLQDADAATRQAEAALQKLLDESREDPPVWEDWGQFWGRCQQLVEAIARVYHPDQKRPLLNIYLPQAYGLLRGTVDDMDQWMQKLGPVLNQVTIGQAYQAYELYQKWEPSARKAWQTWRAARWLLNPVAAAAGLATQKAGAEANQQLLGNLSQLLREAALQNLGRQAIALYGNRTNLEAIAPGSSANQADSGNVANPVANVEVLTSPGIAAKAGIANSANPGSSNPARPTASNGPTTQTQVQTLRQLLQQNQPTETLQTAPVNILLAGRTSAGKSSLINTLFIAQQELAPPQAKAANVAPMAQVDALPSTEQLQHYRWQSPASPDQSLMLWDSPGYEQVQRPELRQAVLEASQKADLLVLVTPALDPALQMDQEFLAAVKAVNPHLPVIGVVSQVDRLRPLREWQPPYDWQWGSRPKEQAIRAAVAYRQQALADTCDRFLPLVNRDRSLAAGDRPAWGDGAIATALVEAIAPAQQARLARFLRDLDARSLAAARIIDQYRLQMSAGKGLTTLIKRPVMTLLSTWLTGSTTWGELMAAKLPAEQAPLVLGKLQMAYELWELLQPQLGGSVGLLEREQAIASLWPLLTDGRGAPEQNAWAFGQSLVAIWTQASPPPLSDAAQQIQQRFEQLL